MACGLLLTTDDEVPTGVPVDSVVAERIEAVGQTLAYVVAVDRNQREHTYLLAAAVARVTPDPTPDTLETPEELPTPMPHVHPDPTEVRAPPELGGLGDVRSQFEQGWRSVGGSEEWLALATAALIPCESGWNVYAYNPEGPYLGLGQWLESTWSGIASATGFHDIYDPFHQGANIAYKVLRDGPGAWPSCW